MPIEAQGEVTRLLEEIAAANNDEDAERASDAKRALFDHVHHQLKKMAHGRLRWERPDHSWETAGLVHEVYLRLMKCERVFTKDRDYFFGAAARAMGDLLREHARKRKCRPEGHPDPQGYTLLDQLVEEAEANFGVDVLDLTEALDELKTTGKHGERWHDVVRLRIWGSLTYPKIAKDLGLSVATVERDWQAARAWLYGRLKGRSIDD
jgi:RNA polymerase sigma factor (TIGR02999 family)